MYARRMIYVISADGRVIPEFGYFTSFDKAEAFVRQLTENSIFPTTSSMPHESGGTTVFVTQAITHYMIEEINPAPQEAVDSTNIHIISNSVDGQAHSVINASKAEQYNRPPYSVVSTWERVDVDQLPSEGGMVLVTGQEKNWGSRTNLYCMTSDLNDAMEVAGSLGFVNLRVVCGYVQKGVNEKAEG